ncbi:MAG: chemotaxis protein CheA [Planctomycetota bacterium]|jgi:two-component system chemotaxis sensor kinase CheA
MGQLLQNNDGLGEFLDIFITESQDRFDELNKYLVDLENNPANEEILYAILRNAHSLKGSAGMFGFENLNRVAHRIEDLMEMFHGQPETVDQEVMDILFEGCDILQIAFQRIAGGDHSATITPREESYLNRIDTLIIKVSQEEGNFDQDLETLLIALENTPSGDQADWGALQALGHRLRSHLQAQTEGAKESPPSADGVRLCLGEKDVTAPLRDGLALLQKGRSAPLDETEVAQFIIHLHTLLETADTSPTPELGPALDEIRESMDLFMELDLEFDDLQVEYYHQALTELVTAIGVPEEEPPEEFPPPVPGVEPQATSSTPSPDSAPSAASDPAVPREVRQARKTVRVEEVKIDAFLDSVGEMIILGEVFNHLQKRVEGVSGGNLELMREFKTANAAFSNQVFSLQNSLMDIRRVALRNITGSLSRLVRDTSHDLGKEVRFSIEGEDAVIDKSLLDKVNTCLVHIVRNSVDHGIESPETRSAHGKSASATIHVSAENEDGFLLIRVEDDGRGLDAEQLKEKALAQQLLSATEVSALSTEEAHRLIFHPGFSTATTVTDISGRGVGLNAVQEFVHAMSGSLDVKSTTGEGCTFSFRIPLSVMLSVLDGMVVSLGDVDFVIPVRHIVESFQITPDTLTEVSGKGECVLLRGEIFPLLRLAEAFALTSTATTDPIGILVQLETRKICLIADNVVDHQQVVIKPIEGLGHLPGIMGGCLLGDGSIGLVLDIEGLTEA